MTNHHELDAVFHALADPTRRAILRSLTRGEASVTALAQPHPIALPTFLRHVGVLEAGGLVTTRKVGRTRLVRASPARLATAEAWIASLHRGWSDRLDRLEALLTPPEAGDPDAP